LFNDLKYFSIKKTVKEFIMANNLFVSYRPSVAERDLAPLIRAIASLGGYTQVQELFWYLNSNKNAETALEVMRDNIDPSDTLIVIDTANNEFEMNRNLREQVESRVRHLWD
jgi:spore cortex formation protein SpoVR/YcgB (stage V sporulation)